LFRRQECNPPAFSQVSVQSGIAFIHSRTVFAGPNPPPLRKRGILKYRSRENHYSLFRDRENSYTKEQTN
jgi:hypothetical protein